MMIKKFVLSTVSMDLKEFMTEKDLYFEKAINAVYNLYKSSLITCVYVPSVNV